MPTETGYIPESSWARRGQLLAAVSSDRVQGPFSRQPLLFKLHSPDNYIVGGGYFAHFSRIPVSLAWSVFGERNGAATFDAMRRRIAKYRGAADPEEDYVLGCIILQDRFFLERPAWFSVPKDFSPNIVRFKGYDLTIDSGRALWSDVLAARNLGARPVSDPAAAPTFADPALVRRRLRQGAFRVLITDTYERHCAVTGE